MVPSKNNTESVQTNVTDNSELDFDIKFFKVISFVFLVGGLVSVILTMLIILNGHSGTDPIGFWVRVTSGVAGLGLSHLASLSHRELLAIRYHSSE